MSGATGAEGGGGAPAADEGGRAAYGADASAVAWLLASSEPAIRRLARRDLLGEPVADDPATMDGPKVAALLAGQRPNGGFGGHSYRKWGGGGRPGRRAVPGAPG